MGLAGRSEDPETPSHDPELSSDSLAGRSEDPETRSRGPEPSSDSLAGRSEDPETRSRGPEPSSDSLAGRSEGPETRSRGPELWSGGLAGWSEDPEALSRGLDLPSEGLDVLSAPCGGWGRRAMLVGRGANLGGMAPAVRIVYRPMKPAPDGWPSAPANGTSSAFIRETSSLDRMARSSPSTGGCR
jgi:hypothetical protein